MQTTIDRLLRRRAELEDREGGFTLIELLIVIVILAILAAIIVFAVQNLTGSSAKSACESDVATVDHAVQAYSAQVGAQPASIANLMTSTTGADGTNTVGPWLHNVPTNGKHYAVVVTAKGAISVQAPAGDGVTVGSNVYTVGNDTPPATGVTPSSVCSSVS
jgi:general secretion pathway protein G